MDNEEGFHRGLLRFKEGIFQKSFKAYQGYSGGTKMVQEGFPGDSGERDLESFR